MLRTFTVENFQSILSPLTVSLLLNQHAPADNRSAEGVSGDRINKVLAVIGANASGKTTCLKALTFVHWFMAHSFQAEPDSKLPFYPHFTAPKAPSRFEVEFEYEGDTWRYFLAATTERVLHESLYKKTSRAYSYVFQRDWDESKDAYGVKLQGFGISMKQAVKARRNASLISTAAQFGEPLALLLTRMNVASNVTVAGRQSTGFYQLHEASQVFIHDDQLKKQMIQLVRQWDLGLADITFEKRRISFPEEEEREIYEAFGVHRFSGDEEHRLAFLLESSGTQSAFVLLARLLPVLAHGGIAIIDELEADLHPHMLNPIMDLFFSPSTNPHNSQILFTTHSLEVLNNVHKGQVVLVEKNEGESTGWRLDSMVGVRADDNLYAKYMAGAYGAVPDL